MRDVLGRGRLLVLIVATACALGVASAVPVRAQSLTDALISAYRTSGLLEQNRALLRAADEDVAAAISTLRPTLSYVAEFGWSRPVLPGSDRVVGALALQASWLIHDFGASRLRADVAKEVVLSTRHQLAAIEQDVLFRAVTAYMSVRRQIAVVRLRENNVRLINEQLRAARERFQVGEVTRTDVSVVEARLANARSGLAVAQGTLAQSRAEYLAAVGASAGALATPPTPPATATSLSAAQAVAQARHPNILSLKREVRAAELAVEAANASTRPALIANGLMSIDNDGDDRQSLSITLQGPIYQGGAIASAVRQAKARRDAARSALLVTTQSVQQSVSNAWANLDAASAVLDATGEQVRAARLALRGAQEELDVGARTTLDVLDREQELLQAETDRIDAATERYIAVYDLLAAMGLLSVDHLNLGVPTYDPAAYYNAVKDAPVVDVSPQGERLDNLLRAIGRE